MYCRLLSFTPRNECICIDPTCSTRDFEAFCVVLNIYLFVLFTMDVYAPFDGVFKQMRYLVSKDKYRYTDNELGVDLDLTYVTDRIIGTNLYIILLFTVIYASNFDIAMGFPADEMSLESTYRNKITEVAALLKKRHDHKFQVYNLCVEGIYDKSKFDNKVLDVGWPDHHSPSLKQLVSIIQSIESFLNHDNENVVAIHCMAGTLKG